MVIILVGNPELIWRGHNESKEYFEDFLNCNCEVPVIKVLIPLTTILISVYYGFGQALPGYGWFGFRLIFLQWPKVVKSDPKTNNDRTM